MFFNLFKLFQKNEEPQSVEPEKDEVLASISYLVYRNSPSVSIDIEMSDYDEESASAICSMLDVLSQDLAFAETVNMIQTALISDKREDLLIKIFTHISEHSRDKILTIKQDSKKDEPCIKPSDML
jgi:hypothetical protein